MGEKAGMSAAVIYNVTSLVNELVEEEWLRWMQDIHIPEVLGTGCFTRHQLVKLLDMDETQGPTYAVQYFASSRQHYDQYAVHYAPALKQEVKLKWGEKVLAFSSLMGIVQ